MSTKPGDWWTESLNLWEGCTPVSEACENCWALSMIRRFRGWEPGDIHYFPERIKIAEKWRKQRHIFVGSLTDILHEAVPDEKIISLLSFVRYLTISCQHYCYLLTKRPERITTIQRGMSERGLSPHFNLRERIGITAENQYRLNERWPYLEQTSAVFKWLSLEPILGPIDLTQVLPYVQWVVVGAESGPRARPTHIQWVRDIRDQCISAHKPFWLKSMGRKYCGYEPMSGQQRDCFYYTDETNRRILDDRTWEERP